MIPEEVQANKTMMTPQEIGDTLDALPGRAQWVILSGGNPALQHLSVLRADLHTRGYLLQVETQGTVWREWLGEVDQIIVSPKPPSSGMWPDTEEGQERVRHTLDRFVSYARHTHVPIALKIVVFDEEDFKWAKGCLNWNYDMHGVPGFLSVGNDYGVDTTEDLLKKYEWLCDRTMNDPHGGQIRVLPQMHVLLWGNARGV